MSLIFGLDSGGTKTIAVTADRSGAVVDHWTGPGFDPMTGTTWIDTFNRAKSALVPEQRPVAAALGFACYGEVETVSALQRDVAARAFTGAHIVLNDVEVACDGAFAGQDGVLVLAGTGSMAWAKAGDKSLRIGGWGEAFGDEGSAFWIGREALSLASQSLDGRRPDPVFADAILDACGTDADGLIAWAFGQSNPRPAFAALARTVSSLADSGNDTASALLRLAADQLEALARSARTKLASPDLAWSYAGGLFRSPQILAELTARLGNPSPPRLPPVGGALWRAARLAGWETDARFTDALALSLAHLPPTTGEDVK